ncbi:cornifelin homolog B-like [Poeciliopsis prolifica]|uniref:cornifelin homolog B-like n=1 Tax=Poeciliopsis prolifica TaxID=188132 RepID=UPI002412F916|nr:cornifelin homolog B-like [Poeciliopsis prolifica]
MSTTLVIQKPPPTQVVEVMNPREWSTGLFDCLGDLKTCCFAYWCFPCFACKTSKDYGEHLCLPLLDAFGWCVPPITLGMRVSMRHRYGIDGSLPNDCVLSSFCTVCIWCQMAREIEKRNAPVMIASKTI